jgi:hypothetical protein
MDSNHKYIGCHKLSILSGWILSGLFLESSEYKCLDFGVYVFQEYGIKK